MGMGSRRTGETFKKLNKLIKIIKCFADEILHSILEDIGKDVFCLLVDESRDVSCKEQMAVVLRYVDKFGLVKESFVGLVYVKDTTSSNLKSCIDSLFAGFNLSMKQVRGQGYDGASNMRGEFNRLQSLIMRENSSAYYAHCFAHQLQLVVVAVARKNIGIAECFSKICLLFEFVYYLHLMLTILTITNTLSIDLQRKDQDTVNAVNCVRSTRSLLDKVRREEWEKVLAEVYAFCDEHDIFKLEMDEAYIDPTRPRKKTGITNKHHFQVDCFNEVLDWLLQELDSSFNETTSQLLVCSAAFNPRDSFQDFNVDNLISLAKLYPSDFDSVELRELNTQLCLYIVDVREDDRFVNIQTIVELSQKMVETRKHLTYHLVYRLLKLVLVLPVATATVERIFSAMKVVKTNLRNRMGDQYMSNSLICYVEKDKLMEVTNKVVVDRFKKMAERKY